MKREEALKLVNMKGDEFFEYHRKNISGGIVAQANRIKKLLDRIENIPKEYPKQIRVRIEWKRSNTWGMCPTCEIWTNNNYYRGYAGGCGYDKESESFAKAFNASPEADFLSIEAKKRGVEAYGVSRYDFHGGVGMECFVRFFEKMGYECTQMHGHTFDGYEFKYKRV